jgi:hypothetical protein
MQTVLHISFEFFRLPILRRHPLLFFVLLPRWSNLPLRGPETLGLVNTVVEKNIFLVLRLALSKQ